MQSIEDLCAGERPVTAHDGEQYADRPAIVTDGSLRLLTPPPLGPERPTSTEHLNYDVANDLRIVQWNVNGLQTATATLWNDIVHGNISALFIQEQYIHYRRARNWNPINLRGYHRYQDPHHKTAIYIRDGVTR